ncbi:cation-translocating P-type ATPase [Ferroacidibacillus organovorans]|uniref:Cation-transporting P-type ATPase N-terminal domain-containing protein n=1 Tax=Ferroacidibacillus organovorans TaxID=1765683 RepID=A0A101XP49_9BACL|nr:cation-transporting P-type ATPase [Ferroacidibacillus organovorans]KUO94975.1 hypothetical protein ATW55_04900 [Ferroacidibacillus organovorans]
MSETATVIHELPGRIRVRVKWFHVRPNEQAAVLHALRELPWMLRLDLNALTGNLLIFFHQVEDRQDQAVKMILSTIDDALHHAGAQCAKRSMPSSDEAMIASIPGSFDDARAGEKRVSRARASGLTTKEAQERLCQYGENRLPLLRDTPWWRHVLKQGQDGMTLLLLGLAGLSFFSKRFAEGGALLFVIMVNSVVTVLQQHRTGRDKRTLAAMTEGEVIVFRDGQRVNIAKELLVPGDLVWLEEGVQVPADGELVESYHLACDESLLTGEPVAIEKSAIAAPVSKTRMGEQHLSDTPSASSVVMGSFVARGTGVMIVTQTGSATVMGRIAKGLVEPVSLETPLQRSVTQFSRAVVTAIGFATALLILVGIMRKERVGPLLLSALSIGASAIPEGLPVLIGIALTAGVRRMQARKALVQRPSALETLGRSTVICSDKTGTLTKNEMTVRVLFDGTHVQVLSDPETLLVNAADHPLRASGHMVNLLTKAVLCSNAEWVEQVRDGEKTWALRGDATEGALLAAARSAGIPLREIRAKYARLDERPFESERQRMSVVCQGFSGSELIVKGAVEPIFARCAFYQSAYGLCELDDESRARILSIANAFSREAYRVICLAYRPLPHDAPARAEDEYEENLIFLGLVGMEDPPREHVEQGIRACREAGIRVLMMTGDHPETARATARRIGLATQETERVLLGGELAQLSDEQLQRACLEVSIFARVTPHDKLRIVTALKATGHVVVMTGDGVNDALAIRHADVGIAMGQGGTALAREASSITLVDDDFNAIIRAVDEGRGILGNIRRALGYLLSGNLGEILFSLFAVLFGLPLPFVPIQILLINLLTDAAPTLTLLVRPKRHDGMLRVREADLNDRNFLTQLIVRALSIGGSTLLLYRALQDRVAPRVAQSAALTMLVLVQWFQVESWHHDGAAPQRILPRQRFMQGVLAISLVALIGALYIPPLAALVGLLPLPPGIFFAAAATAYAAQLLHGGIMQCLRHLKLSSTPSLSR